MKQNKPTTEARQSAINDLQAMFLASVVPPTSPKSRRLSAQQHAAITRAFDRGVTAVQIAMATGISPSYAYELVGRHKLSHGGAGQEKSLSQRAAKVLPVVSTPSAEGGLLHAARRAMGGCNIQIGLRIDAHDGLCLRFRLRR